MQLKELTSSDWAALSELIAHLWILAAILIGTGLSYIVAHGMVPSLVDTGDVPRSTGRLMRAPLYGLVALGLGGLVAVVVKATLLALAILPEVYGRLAI